MTKKSAQLLDRLRFRIRVFRELAGRFIILPPERDTIIGKAAVFVVSEAIEGDYLEFGVYKGESLATAYRTFEAVYSREMSSSTSSNPQRCEDLKKRWDSMRFFAFDSFQGLPELKGPDSLTKDFTPGQFRTSSDEFWAHLRRRKIDTSKVVAVEGWFEDTLTDDTRTRLGIKKAAVVHIDSDLYASAKLALSFITPVLQDGTILIFDDWFNYRGHPALGERRALREWHEQNPKWGLTEYHKEGVRRNSFIVNDLTLRADLVTT